MGDVLSRERGNFADIMKGGEIRLSTMRQAINNVRAQVRGRLEEISSFHKRTILEGFEFDCSFALLDVRGFDRMILMHRESKNRYLAFDGAVIFMFSHGNALRIIRGWYVAVAVGEDQQIDIRFIDH